MYKRQTIISVTSTLGGLTDTLSITVSEPYLDFETGAFYALPGERIYSQITGGGGVDISVTVRTESGASGGEYIGGRNKDWPSMSGGCVPFDFVMPDSGVVYIRASAFDSNQNGSAGVNINTSPPNSETPTNCGSSMGGENIPLLSLIHI